MADARHPTTAPVVRRHRIARGRL